MSNPSKEIFQYKDTISELFGKIATEEVEPIKKAAKMLGDSIMRDQVIHVIGPGGHSNMAVEEVFWRAGGFVCVNAILDTGTNLSQGAIRSTKIERTTGYAKPVLDSWRVGKDPGEVLVIVNAYGVNSMSVDCALECKERGVTSIAITSRSFADRLPRNHPSRHPSGANLYQSVDIFINNHLPYGDAVLEIEGCEQNMGPVSTFVNCFAVNYLVIETAKYMVSKGHTPPLFRSGNMPGGDEYNKNLIEKYTGRAILLF